MRKEAGFEVMDKILSYAKDNDKIMDIMKANQDEIKCEVLADESRFWRDRGLYQRVEYQ